MAARPLLGMELLAGINPKASIPLACRFPHIGGGPNLPHRPGQRRRRPGCSSLWASPAQQQATALLGRRRSQQALQKRQRLPTNANLPWHLLGHPSTLCANENPFPPAMSDFNTEAKEAAEAVENAAADAGFDFNQRYGEVIGKVNATLDKVDWSHLGKIGKIAGILLAVIVAQILIKGVLDTINLLPIVPGLLELLGLVVVGTWSWENLTTSEKRAAVLDRLQGIKKEYIG
jgi:hypothetical protein